MTNHLKRPAIILLAIVLLLLVPVVAMQFTEEVNWTLSDFLVAGAMLLILGALIEIGARFIKGVNPRIVFIVAVILVFLLIWAELAVGIFGTPFAGD